MEASGLQSMVERLAGTYWRRRVQIQAARAESGEVKSMKNLFNTLLIYETLKREFT